MKDITICHPRLQELASKLLIICAEQGVAIKIGETLRTAAEQDELYAQGRTKPGNIVTNAKGSTYSSQHQWGIAFDFYLMVDVDGDGQKTDDAYNDATGLFSKVGKLAKSIGLGWGGDWTSLVDKPHLYLPDWGSTTVQLKNLYGSPAKFMQTWKKEFQEGFLPASDGQRWWYQYKDGSYAHSNWYWLTEAASGTSGWYLFDEAGYMLTGYQRDLAGDRFFLCPDKGADEGKCMITDARGVLMIVEKYDFENHRYIL